MRDLSDFGVEVLHHKLQNRSHLPFVHSAKPLNEVVDCCALRRVAEKGRHRQPHVFEHPSPAQPAGHALHRRTVTPVNHAVISLSIEFSSTGDSWGF